MKSLSETIVEEVERKIVSGMTQQRRSYAIARRRLVVENVVANAVSLVLRPDLDGTRRCAVPTAKYKPTRYDRQDYPKRLLSDTLQAMESQGLILRHPYIFRQRATTIEPSSNLVEGISRHNVRLDHVGRAPGAETIWINARTGKLDHRDHTPIKRRVYYDDTDETTFLREQMERINAAANQADFRFDGDRQAPVAMRRMFLLRAETDPHAFNLSGRLFGPWWQGVKSTQRHLITIGGEPIADMDYSGCFLQLLYIKETGGLFTGEPYAVPGLEDFRDGAKDGLLSLLSRSSPMQRLTPELRGLLPEGWTARRLVEAFSAYHPAIAQHFATDIGVELMNTESRIMVELLLRLETMGIEAQCLHDGIQVARSAKSKAVEAMVEVSERLLGVALTVKEKAVKGLDGCQAVAA